MDVMTPSGEIILDNAEVFALTQPDSQEKRVICKLVSTVRNLQRQLTDPNYMYASARIHRQALIHRDKENESLRDQVLWLRGINSELLNASKDTIEFERGSHMAGPIQRLLAAVSKAQTT